MDTIILEVEGGLANRLRSLVSGICYAEELEKKLIVIWHYNAHCAILGEECINMISLPQFVSFTNKNIVAKDMFKKCKIQEDLDDKPLVISSCYHFYKKNPNRWLHHLRAIQFYIQPTINEPTIGFHYRATDNKHAMEMSPFELFINTASITKGKLYFSSDDIVAKTIFKDIATMTNGILNRFSKDGIITAIQDFINLSKCIKIYGSHYSSFNEMAALYGGVELIILTK
jgi:hypothetical protein